MSWLMSQNGKVAPTTPHILDGPEATGALMCVTQDTEPLIRSWRNLVFSDQRGGLLPQTI